MKNINEFLANLLQVPEIDEGVIISTCNRVEILFSSQTTSEAIPSIKHFLARSNNLTVNDIDPFLYFYADKDAIRHVFRVASSLDSMVVGEPQILGQLKDAYRNAVECNATGTVLNRFFAQSILSR